jgi:hypothetical protein
MPAEKPAASKLTDLSSTAHDIDRQEAEAVKGGMKARAQTRSQISDGTSNTLGFGERA